ncbi:MAG: hypothetical protein KAJ03_05425 [Gammaproteobacteria bacterium]|nr:hypothetical protein [Gammaproteobacteria bacterium]
MRAKMKIHSVEQFDGGSEVLRMSAVCKSDPYPDDGFDEDNTFATFTPTASLEIQITNPDLIGKFKPGQKYYLDFSKAP